MPIVTNSGDYLPIRINQYFKDLRYYSALRDESQTLISLGTPAAASGDNIFDGVTATTTAQSYTSANFKAGFTGEIDCKYGRTLQYTGSAGANHVVTVKGRDYLGQLMAESVTLSGATIIQGKKAFKFVDSMTVAAGASGDTLDVGYGNRLGIPFRAMELLYALEDDTLTTVGQQLVRQPAEALVDVSGANAATIYAPQDGYIVGVSGKIVADVTTDFAVIDATLDGTGVSALDFEVPIGATGIGFGVELLPANYVAVQEGQALALTSDGDPAAGTAQMVGLFAKPHGAFNAADNTATATATTGDTRGTYKPFITLNGAKEVIVCITGDARLNDNGEGGLLGVPHYYA